MKRQHQSLLVHNKGAGGGSGGLGGGIAYVQYWNPNTATFKPVYSPTQGSESLDATNGNMLIGTASWRASGTTSTNGPLNTFTEANAPATIFAASTRFDTGGVSDGATAADYLLMSEVETYSGADYVYNGGHAACAIEVSGMSGATISSVLATGAQQGLDTDPTLTIPASGLTYDALIITAGWGADSDTTTEKDITADITPSVAMAGYTAHHAHVSYRSDAFIGIMPAYEGAFTLALTTRGFSAGGWVIRCYGVTAA